MPTPMTVQRRPPTSLHPPWCIALAFVRSVSRHAWHALSPTDPAPSHLLLRVPCLAQMGLDYGRENCRPRGDVVQGRAEHAQRAQAGPWKAVPGPSLPHHAFCAVHGEELRRKDSCTWAEKACSNHRLDEKTVVPRQKKPALITDTRESPEFGARHFSRGFVQVHAPATLKTQVLRRLRQNGIRCQMSLVQGCDVPKETYGGHLEDDSGENSNPGREAGYGKDSSFVP